MDYIIKICCDGTVEKVDATGKEILATILEQIHGFFEIIRYAKVPKPYVMLVDDGGQLKGLHYNKIASQLYGASIVGDALIMIEGFNNMGEPDLSYLTEHEADEVIEYLNAAEYIKKYIIVIPYDSASKYNAHVAKDKSLVNFIMSLETHEDWVKAEPYSEVEILYCTRNSETDAPFYNKGLKVLFGIDGTYSAALIVKDTDDMVDAMVSTINNILRSNDTKFYKNETHNDI